MVRLPYADGVSEPQSVDAERIVWRLFCSFSQAIWRRIFWCASSELSPPPCRIYARASRCTCQILSVSIYRDNRSATERVLGRRASVCDAFDYAPQAFASGCKQQPLPGPKLIKSRYHYESYPLAYGTEVNQIRGDCAFIAAICARPRQCERIFWGNWESPDFGARPVLPWFLISI